MVTMIAVSAVVATVNEKLRGSGRSDGVLTSRWGSHGNRTQGDEYRESLRGARSKRSPPALRCSQGGQRPPPSGQLGQRRQSGGGIVAEPHEYPCGERDS